MEEEIKKKKLTLILVSEEASERTKRKFQILCEQYQVPVITVGTIEELSKAIGKINKAIIGIKDKNFAEAIKKIYDGGDRIG